MAHRIRAFAADSRALPTDRLALGDLVINPKEPDRPLTRVTEEVLQQEYPTVAYDLPYGPVSESIDKADNSRLRFTTPLRGLLSFAVSFNRSTGDILAYEADKVHKRMFLQFPSRKEIERRLKEEAVLEFLNGVSRPFIGGGRALYMVSGIATATNLSFKTTEIQDQKQSLQLGFEATKFTPDHHSKSSRVSEEVVLGYQLLRIVIPSFVSKVLPTFSGCNRLLCIPEGRDWDALAQCRDHYLACGLEDQSLSVKLSGRTATTRSWLAGNLISELLAVVAAAKKRILCGAVMPTVLPPCELPGMLGQHLASRVPYNHGWGFSHLASRCQLLYQTSALRDPGLRLLFHGTGIRQIYAEGLRAPTSGLSIRDRDGFSQIGTVDSRPYAQGILLCRSLTNVNSSRHSLRSIRLTWLCGCEDEADGRVN
ncbi:hypothetical protein BO82DRAFT_364695 [Aspergillus uvarum CBS 121591]|uniref:Uncharacterized protein n=1 Tax=Aspergillus uvarum CBS 121591 TaxID=1448315 RepID=A0A319CEK6_9EURO|nr:hypothetical protein BO82DRAFT_364695 [Aspergillus uvarum CBS 121591]PYH81797.1 hypothetical protein BO82DRAFT_364695 [Aspergillus uvarum CBS 121591]